MSATGEREIQGPEFFLRVPCCHTRGFHSPHQQFDEIQQRPRQDNQSRNGNPHVNPDAELYERLWQIFPFEIEEENPT